MPDINWSVDDSGRVIPTINVFGTHVSPQATVLNRANPQTTYVSPNTAQPATAVPVVGQTDTQSGQPVHATYNMPSAPDTATAARTYRAQHGLSTSDDTDALNAESLAAAQAGRTYFDPTLARQYAMSQSYGPTTNVVNALQAPSAATNTAQSTSPQSIAMVPRFSPTLVTNNNNNLLWQGGYG